VPTAYLTRIVEFSATHRVRRPDWTAAQNAATFGEAAGDHAHHYQCRVTVRGPLVAAQGGIVDLAALDALLRREIRDRLDGRHINEALPEFGPEGGDRLATGEALAVYLWERLWNRMPSGVTLHAIRVQEGPDLYSEYFGEA
jgi:6-pyruvoyltetrahydropterin/6-carboxytetrahydropterin synthase